MLRHVLMLVLGSTLFLPGIAQGQEFARTDSTLIDAVGTATRQVRADRATVTLTVSGEDSTPAAAGMRLNARIDSLRRAIAALGIPRDSIVSASQWGWWNGRVERVPGNRCVPEPDPRRGCRMVFDTTYRAKDALTVHVSDIRTVGPLIDAALRLDVTEISSVAYAASDTRAAEEEALQEATLRARRSAEVMARASGGRLGRTLRLSSVGDWCGGGYGFRDAVQASVSTGAQGREVTAPWVAVHAAVCGRWRLEAP